MEKNKFQKPKAKHEGWWEQSQTGLFHPLTKPWEQNVCLGTVKYFKSHLGKHRHRHGSQIRSSSFASDAWSLYPLNVFSSYSPMLAGNILAFTLQRGLRSCEWKIALDKLSRSRSRVKNAPHLHHGGSKVVETQHTSLAAQPAVGQGPGLALRTRTSAESRSRRVTRWCVQRGAGIRCVSVLLYCSTGMSTSGTEPSPKTEEGRAAQLRSAAVLGYRCSDS